MSKSNSPPITPEYDAFKALAEKLVQVPATEIKQKREADPRAKPKAKPKKARKKANS